MFKAAYVTEVKQRNKRKDTLVPGTADCVHWKKKIRREFLVFQLTLRKSMRNFFLILLTLSAFFCVLFDLTESWRRRRRRRCYRQNCAYYWSSYGSCSKTCGGGKQNQRVVITRNPACGGTACPSQRYRTVSCNPQCCRVNCAWTWNSWSPCNGCGMSQQTRTKRITTNPSCGGFPCPIIRSETRNCNTGV